MTKIEPKPVFLAIKNEKYVLIKLTKYVIFLGGEMLRTFKNLLSQNILIISKYHKH